MARAPGPEAVAELRAAAEALAECCDNAEQLWQFYHRVKEGCPARGSCRRHSADQDMVSDGPTLPLGFIFWAGLVDLVWRVVYKELQELNGFQLSVNNKTSFALCHLLAALDIFKHHCV